jgi:glycogen operon protein
LSQNGTGYPELSFHSLIPWDSPENRPGLTFAYLYAEDHKKYKTDSDAFIYVAVNAHWEEHRFTLPDLPEGYQWRLAFEAYGVDSDPDKAKIYHDQTGINLGPRTTAVLIGSTISRI